MSSAIYIYGPSATNYLLPSYAAHHDVVVGELGDGVPAAEVLQQLLDVHAAGEALTVVPARQSRRQ